MGILKGLFITFEGPDGAGKTSQLQLLASYIKKLGYDLVTTREPGGTKISDKIRSLLLDPVHTELTDQTEILLYAASRAQLVHELILPSLEQGKIVLCDRFIDASIAYQAYGLGKSKEMVEQINSFASSRLTPDRTYLLNLSPEAGRVRLEQRKHKEFGNELDRIEQKNIEYHQRVYDGFQQLAHEHQERIKVIDADKNIEAIAKEVQQDFQQLISKIK